MQCMYELLLAALVGAVSFEHYHIVPVDHTAICQHYPNGTCFTLDQLSSQISDAGDVTISFLPGEHLLTWNMTFINRSNITLNSEQLDNVSNGPPRIRCIPDTQISITETDMFSLQELVIYNCQKQYAVSNGGGAVYLEKTAAMIKNCVFKTNSVVCRFCEGGALCSKNSKVTIDSCVFSENRAQEFGGGIYTFKGTIHITRTIFENNSAVYTKDSLGGGLHSSDSAVTIDSCMFSGNSAVRGGGMLVHKGTVHIMRTIFEHNRAREGAAMSISGGILSITGTIYINNTASNGDGGALYAWAVHYDHEVYITDSNFECNTALAGNGGAVAAKDKGKVMITNSTFSSNQALKGGVISSIGQVILFDLSQTITMHSNTAHYGGAIYLKQSELQSSNINYQIATGKTFVTSNIAKQAGGGIYAVQSKIQLSSGIIYNNTALQDGGGIHLTASSIELDRPSIYHHRSNWIISNTAGQFGGGIFLQDKSQIKILNQYSINPTMKMINNIAKRGGAIYVSDSGSEQLARCDKFTEEFEDSTFKKCFIQQDNLGGLYFEKNSAEETGSDIYGGLLDRCIVEQSKGSILGITFLKDKAVFKTANDTLQFFNHISSDPVRVCFCQNDVIDCDYTHSTVFKKKGETFTLSVVAVDQVSKPVNAILISSLQSNNRRIEQLNEEQEARPINNFCTDLEYNVYSRKSNTALEIYANGPCGKWGISKQVVNITFEPCTCPIGLEKVSDYTDCICDCAHELKQYISNCSPENGTIQINENVWIEYINCTNSTSKFVTQQCPVDYCVTKPVNISLVNHTEADRQCAFNRTGKLCGQCEQGLSLVFASSRCQQCSNYYLFLLLPFALAGIALVAFILLLNITVATGTIHGLIFYANMLAANQYIFLPFNNNFLTVFISWLNFDLGIETCFYNGMNSYGKFLLQLVFPAYLFLLIAIIMVLCNRSQRIAGLFGKKNPEATLYTLIFLSYSKLIRLIITALQKAHIDNPDSQKIFWLYDANVPYFTASHIPRFLAAFIITILGAVYTTLLLFGQLFNHCSEHRLMKWTTHRYYIHFLKAHHAPVSDKHRYWVGLLLLARLVHYLISAFTDNYTTILSVYLLTILLLLLKTRNRIYNNWLLDTLETIFIINLNILAVANSVIKPETQGIQQTLATVSISVSFIAFLVIVLYHILDSCGVKLGELPNTILTALREHRHNQPVIVIEEKEADNYELLAQHDDNQLREPMLDDMIPVHYNRPPTPPPQCKAPTFTEIDIRGPQNTSM